MRIYKNVASPVSNEKCIGKTTETSTTNYELHPVQQAVYELTGVLPKRIKGVR